MPRCSRNGCRREFQLGDLDKCVYHPGQPVFHEGLKSWSCCADVNKPVLSFDEFMSISGCAEVGQHSEDTPRPAVQKTQASTKTIVVESKPEVEVYGVNPGAIVDQTPDLSPPPSHDVEGEDDLTIPVAPGAVCKHKGCGVPFVSDEVNRLGDGDGTVCVYHPQPPLFREGSKGYLCCKRRVLEFEEFLKIPGCKTGRHVFASKHNDKSVEVATCRIDHYQTPTAVHVSVFAKQADKERSSIQFQQNMVLVDLYLPGMKRFHRVLNLFGPIDPARCSFQILNTKVELNLQKQDNRSWTLLEKTNKDLGNISLTFGVGGRTGTVGAKQPIFDETNKGKI